MVVLDVNPGHGPRMHPESSWQEEQAQREISQSVHAISEAAQMLCNGHVRRVCTPLRAQACSMPFSDWMHSIWRYSSYM